MIMLESAVETEGWIAKGRFSKPAIPSLIQPPNLFSWKPYFCLLLQKQALISIRIAQKKNK